MVMMLTCLADLERLELDVLVAFQLLDELDERLVADHVHPLDVAVRSPRNISRRPRPTVCSGRMLAFAV